MRWLYRISAAALMAYGSIHVIGDIPALIRGPTGELMDFTGLASQLGFSYLVVGVLNLLNDVYGARAAGVRWAAIAINVPMTLLVIRMATMETGWDVVWYWLIPAVFVVLSVVSVIEAMAAHRALRKLKRLVSD